MTFSKHFIPKIGTVAVIYSIYFIPHSSNALPLACDPLWPPCMQNSVEVIEYNSKYTGKGQTDYKIELARFEDHLLVFCPAKFAAICIYIYSLKVQIT